MNDLSVIMLGQNGDKGFTIVDADRFQELKQKRWCLNDKGYAYRGEGPKGPRGPSGRRSIYLHHVVIGGQRQLGRFCDHANGCRLDNRRSNLRWSDIYGQRANSNKRSGTSSKYIGVCRRLDCNRWQVNIHWKGFSFQGLYKTETEAAVARDELAKKHHGEFAKLNFPGGQT